MALPITSSGTGSVSRGSGTPTGPASTAAAATRICALTRSTPAGMPTAATQSTRPCRRRSPTGCPPTSLTSSWRRCCAGIIGYRALLRASLPEHGRLGLYGFGDSAHLVAQVALAQGATVHALTRGETSRRLALELG